MALSRKNRSKKVSRKLRRTRRYRHSGGNSGDHILHLVLKPDKGPVNISLLESNVLSILKNRDPDTGGYITPPIARGTENLRGSDVIVRSLGNDTYLFDFPGTEVNDAEITRALKHLKKKTMKDVLESVRVNNNATRNNVNYQS